MEVKLRHQEHQSEAEKGGKMQISNQMSALLESYTSKSLANKSDDFKKFLTESDAKFKELQDLINSLEDEIKKDGDMFKVFDFMQIMNQLIYGNLDDEAKDELLQKAIKISKEV